MFFYHLILIISSSIIISNYEDTKKVTYYISNDVSSTNDGTYDKPFPFDWSNILKKLNSLSENTDATIIFKEGDYFTTEYGISFSDKKGSVPNRIILKAEEGKRVRIIGGCKVPTNSWKRVDDSRYKNRLWRLDYHNEKFTPKAVIINDRRAMFARSPKFGSVARIRGFESFEDPEDPSYTLRNFEVQPDCIDMLSKLSKDELEVAKFVFFRGEKQYSEIIYKIDKDKKLVITRILSSESSIRNGVVGDFYYIENVMNCLGCSEEIIQLKNGSFLYVAQNSKIDLNSPSSETFLQSPDSYFGFHASKRGNIEIYNFEILNMGNSPLYFSYDSNIYFENLTMSHCNQGPQIQQCENVTIQHCLIQDMGGRLAYISKTDGVLINDSIIKTGGRTTPASQGIWFGVGNNNTVLSNNEIADSYQSLIQIDGADGFNMNKLLSFKIINNHLHHCGKNLFDDMGGIQILNHCRGIVIEHNWIHDVYAPRHAGQAICSCSGTAGTIIRNNLVYDSTQLAFKMDNGCNVTVDNNIFGPGYYGVIGWTNKAPDYYGLDVTRNILIYNSTALIGDFNKQGINVGFDKNIYWNTKGSDFVDFRTLTFEQWKERGYDIHSHIIDPLFTDFEKRDFTFSDDKNIKLIGFVPFDLQFGVIGSDEWKQKAIENVGPSLPGEKDYVSRFYFPSLLQMSGFEDFENDGQIHSEFWKSQTRLIPQKFTIEISNEKAFSGDYSLKFGVTGYELSSKQPYLQIKLDWSTGKVEFGFKMFVDEKAYFSLRFENFLTIDFKRGKCVYDSKQLFEYECNKWNDVKVTIDIDEKNFDIKVDDLSSSLTNQKIESITTIYLFNYDTRNPAYFDDFNATSLYVEPILFSCPICEEENEEEIKSDDDDDDDDDDDKVYTNISESSKNEVSNDDSNKDKDKDKMNPGVVAAIVIPIIIVVIVIVIVVIFVLRKRKKEESSDMIQDDINLN